MCKKLSKKRQETKKQRATKMLETQATHLPTTAEEGSIAWETY
jgi:hypothetical protein